MITKSWLLLLLLINCSLFVGIHCVNAQRMDPLGNPVFDKSGKELYRMQASFGVLEGNSILRRDKEFKKKTGNRNYFTFLVESPEENGLGLRHQLTVGNFPTKFSNFTLDKELFDAARWNITVPIARGRVSLFAGRVTNNTFTVSGERSQPVENQDIASENDWLMAGVRAEASLGSYEFQWGALPSFNVPLPQFGLSFVNRFFTNYDLTRTSNPLKGVTISNPPSEIFLRFRDASPQDRGGAKVFSVQVRIDGVKEYDVIGGAEPPGILLLPHNSNRGAGYRAAEQDGYFVYRFPIFSAQDRARVRFDIDIANDYLVELSTDNKNYHLELSASGNIKDGTNRRLHSFDYGELTDESTMGMDMQMTLFGFSISGERAWYSQTKQYPTLEGRQFSVNKGAWFLDINRSFGPLTFSAEYTHLDPFYHATNFIDDNDDDNPYADSREPEILIVGNTKDDIDGDRIQDWNDDFLLFFADPPKFRLGLNRESIDFNNNGEPDNLEDDDKPNYRLDYDEGSFGHHVFLKMELPLVEGVSVIPGRYEKRMILQNQRAKGWYNIFSYIPERIPNFGTVFFRHTFRRAKDNIPDDVVLRSTGQLIKDNLMLQDYQGNIFTMIVDYQNVKNLTIRTKFKYQRDNLFNTKERLIDTGLINQIRYDYQINKDMTIAPAFRNDRTIGYVQPFDRLRAIDITRNAYMVTLTHRLAAQLQLSAGTQFLTWRDLYEPTHNYNRTVAFFELVLQGQTFGQTVGLLVTADYIIQNYLEPVGGGERRNNLSISLFLL